MVRDVIYVPGDVVTLEDEGHIAYLLSQGFGERAGKTAQPASNKMIARQAVKSATPQ